MTYSTTVPNASQSPCLFPAQANTNFLRIKDIVNNDHNWTDTTSASQGVHRQVTLIDRTPPVSLPAGTNGILFSEDVSGASQLRYYNGSSTYPLTPVVKYWASVSSIGTIFQQSGGLTASQTGTGSYTITFTSPQSNTNYGVNVSVRNLGTDNNIHVANYQSLTVNGFNIRIRNQTPILVSRAFTVTVYGDG